MKKWSYKRGGLMASLEGDNSVVGEYLSANMKPDLIRGVAFDSSGFIRGGSTVMISN
jgi:hypothetical protein